MNLRISRENVIIGPAHASESGLHYTNVLLGLLDDGTLAGQFEALAALRNKAHDPHLGRAVLASLKAFQGRGVDESLQAPLQRTIAAYEACQAPAPAVAA